MPRFTLQGLNCAKLLFILKCIKIYYFLPLLIDKAWWCCDMCTKVEWSKSEWEGMWSCNEAPFLIGTDPLGLWAKPGSPWMPSFLVHYFELVPSSKLINLEWLGSYMDPLQNVLLSRSFYFVDSIFWLLHYLACCELIPNLSSTMVKVRVLESSDTCGCMPPCELGGLILFFEMLFRHIILLLEGICY
jgi:hypothetical protein